MCEEDPTGRIKRLNGIVEHISEIPFLPLRFPKLDKGSLCLQVWSYATYASNHDLTSLLCYIIFLSDESGKCLPLFLSSRKRVTRSVGGSEAMALSDAFDMAYILKHGLQRMTSTKIPIVVLADSLSLFDVIMNVSATTEKRLVIDWNIFRQVYSAKEIDKLGFNRTQYNPVEALTKVMRSHMLYEKRFPI